MYNTRWRPYTELSELQICFAYQSLRYATRCGHVGLKNVDISYANYMTAVTSMIYPL